jgi:hypothetical protein
MKCSTIMAGEAVEVTIYLLGPYSMSYTLHALVEPTLRSTVVTMKNVVFWDVSLFIERKSVLLLKKSPFAEVCQKVGSQVPHQLGSKGSRRYKTWCAITTHCERQGFSPPTAWPNTWRDCSVVTKATHDTTSKTQLS